MNFEEKINENTILHSIEESSVEYAEEDKVLSYILYFTFYDCNYFVFVDREDIDSDESSSLCIEGPSKLFDSFNNACENDLWAIIKNRCDKYDLWFKQGFPDLD